MRVLIKKIIKGKAIIQSFATGKMIEAVPVADLPAGAKESSVLEKENGTYKKLETKRGEEIIKKAKEKYFVEFKTVK